MADGPEADFKVKRASMKIPPSATVTHDECPVPTFNFLSSQNFLYVIFEGSHSDSSNSLTLKISDIEHFFLHRRFVNYCAKIVQNIIFII
jgi:hypothetical protein